MKKLLTILSIAAVIVSCKNAPADNTKVLAAYKDSVQHAEFNKWKAAKEAKQKENTVIYKTLPAQNSVTPTETAPEKKGWSRAAKGAVIGGVTGAAAGAIIDKKNRAAGAVIGGVAGAGVGYGIGRSIDKKHQRN